jgi:aspartate aminotransferase-like enzyme
MVFPTPMQGERASDKRIDLTQELRARLASFAFPETRLFTPGPHGLSPAVTEVLQGYRALYTHRAGEYKTCYARTIDLLRELFNVPTSFTPLVFGHTGSYNWEMVAKNTPDNFRTLGIDIGSFSKRWAQVFIDLGRHADVIQANWGDGITPDRMKEKMADDYDLVLLIQNETSTGVTLDIASLSEAIRSVNPKAYIAVDAVSISGAVEVDIDRIRPDYYLWSLQKDFSIPAIGSVMIVSDRAAELAGSVPNRGYVLDMVEWLSRANSSQTPMTVADLTLQCITARLEEMKAEGTDRFVRHKAIVDRHRAWADGRGLSFLAKPGFESPTVSAISLPEGITGPALTAKAKELLNAQIAPGYGSTADGYIRIAAMGMTTVEETDRLLEGLGILIDNWHELE